MKTVLIADDEKNIRASLTTTFRLDGFRVVAAADGEEAVAAVERGGVDLALLDLQMPKLDGLAALRRMREIDRTLPVILLTAHGTIERAVEAVRLGAYDFIEKPPHSERILLSVRNALRQVLLEEENHELRGEQDARFDMIGASPPMLELFERIRRTAPTQARVLIVGENGTGKELIARALHRNSARADRPFVRVNCAAIPRELFESELFGHEKGAFTGSTTRRRGRFQRADGGTLFLDEVAEIPTELQAKLLRALESGEVEPLGADHEVPVDVRVVAATNTDLERAVAVGSFRQDLYYRLQVVTLEAPPLRRRREDIPSLVERFLAQACAENHLRRSFAPGAVERLARHDYPGNVRELRNLVERLVILAPGETVEEADVERALVGSPQRRESPSLELRGSLHETMLELERQVVTHVLERHGWKMTAAADTLGLERSHLYKKLKLLGIERP
jgi:two-component system nitrogen regulation response regulator NtrX